MSHPLPLSATQTSATVVVQSLHKGAGAITPAAIVHIPTQSSLSPQRLQQALNVLQTSSPSWPLLANCEACTQWLWSPSAQEHLTHLLKTIDTERERLNHADNGFEWYGATHVSQDPVAVLIRNKTLPQSLWACDLEETAGIAYEALNTHSALYKVGLGATANDITSLAEALLAYTPDANPNHHPLLTQPFSAQAMPTVDMALIPREAWLLPHETVPLPEALGRIAAETFAPCPPGIPLWIPGERIQPQHLYVLKALKYPDTEANAAKEPPHDPPDVIVVTEGALR